MKITLFKHIFKLIYAANKSHKETKYFSELILTCNIITGIPERKIFIFFFSFQYLIWEKSQKYVFMILVIEIANCSLCLTHVFFCQNILSIIITEPDQNPIMGSR